MKPQEFISDERGWLVPVEPPLPPPPPKKIMDHLHLIFENGFTETFRVYDGLNKKEVLAFVKPYTTFNDELTDPNHLFRDVVECLEKAELNDGVL